MKAYLAVRRWVDREWVDGMGYKSLVAVSLVPFLPTPLIGNWWIVPGAILSIGWTVFVGWRGVRLARANDLNYDRKTKWSLSKEYHSTESAAKARFKRKRRKK